MKTSIPLVLPRRPARLRGAALRRNRDFPGAVAVGPPAGLPHLSALLVLALLAVGRPALGQYQVYWGDVHGHTAISDGKGSVDDYFTHARDAAGLDFAIVTDHDFGNAAPWRMPRESWTLTQDTADRYTVDGNFVAIAGYEWTSQSKYWTPQEPLFDGPARYYNHKNVYFDGRVDYLFSAKDAACRSPDLLAGIVRRHGGLIHNCHPDPGPEGKDQFDYDPSCYPVITNTEMWSDTIRYEGKTYPIQWETLVRQFLDKGGRTGFVRGTDSHEGKPAARTAVLARELTRSAIFDALRHRRNYAVSGARIVLDFRIDGQPMGAEVETGAVPKISVAVAGTDNVEEVAIVRDGAVVHRLIPKSREVRLEWADESFPGSSYYYVRVTQVDTDEHGNPSCAWASPIWVKSR